MINTLTSKLGKTTLAVLIGISILPLFLNAFGLNFASKGIPIDWEQVTELSKGERVNALFKAVAGGIVHVIMEWTAVVIAVMGVAAGYLLYRNTGRVSVLILTLALAAAGFIDAMHTLVAARLIEAASPTSVAIPFSWAICRLFNAAILVAGGIYFLLKPEETIKSHKSLIISFLIVAVALCTALSVYTIYGDLPKVSFPDSLVTRPYDLLALVVYAVGIVFVFPQLLKRYPTPFMAALTVGFVAQILAQVYMAFHSHSLFDNAFNAGHFLKIVAYTAPFIGVMQEIQQVWSAQRQEGQAEERAAEAERAMAEAKSAQEALRVAEEEKAAERTELATRFEKEISEVVETLRETSVSLSQSVEEVASAASAGSEQTRLIGNETTEAAGSLQTVSAAAEEMSASIQSIAEQTGHASTISAEAADQADRANDRVTSLTAAAESIGDVAKLIAEIAAQTNLLALNATIEAARAGEAGRGFAVVAAEVKDLAGQTTLATEDISKRIQEIREASGSTANDIAQISKVVQSVSEITMGVSDSVRDQRTATGEIATNIQSTSTRTDQISDTIGQLATAASQAADGASGAVKSSKQVDEQIATLSHAINRFMADVRAP